MWASSEFDISALIHKSADFIVSYARQKLELVVRLRVFESLAGYVPFFVQLYEVDIYSPVDNTRERQAYKHQCVIFSNTLAFFFLLFSCLAPSFAQRLFSAILKTKPRCDLQCVFPTVAQSTIILTVQDELSLRFVFLTSLIISATF